MCPRQVYDHVVGVLGLVRARRAYGRILLVEERFDLGPEVLDHVAADRGLGHELDRTHGARPRGKTRGWSQSCDLQTIQMLK